LYFQHFLVSGILDFLLKYFLLAVACLSLLEFLSQVENHHVFDFAFPVSVLLLSSALSGLPCTALDFDDEVFDFFSERQLVFLQLLKVFVFNLNFILFPAQFVLEHLHVFVFGLAGVFQLLDAFV